MVQLPQGHGDTSAAVVTAPVWSLEEMRRADAVTIAGIAWGLVDEVVEVPVEVRASFALMRRAGEAVAAEVMAVLQEGEAAGRFPSGRGGCIGVLVGPGNNGGDGLVIARVLHGRGVPVRVFVAEMAKCSGEVALAAGEWLTVKGETYLVPSDVGGAVEWGFAEVAELPGGWAKLSGRGATAKRIASDGELDGLLRECSVLVDALLGIGQRGAPRGAVERLVRAVRRRQGSDCVAQGETCHNAAVVAVDVPTGVCAESGRVFEPFIAVHRTIAVQGVKRGCLLAPAFQVCGEVRALEVGIAGEEPPCGVMVVGGEGRMRRQRAPDSHKFGLGKVVVVGGSSGMPGAPALAAEAALRAGAGLVVQCRTGAVDESMIRPEVMRAVVGEGDCFASSHLSLVMAALERTSAVIVGPGIGRTLETAAFLEGFFRKVQEHRPMMPMVIDADALSIIEACDKPFSLSSEQKPWIMTPHHGEAARLLGMTVSAVVAAPFATAQEIARRFGVVCVLKGAGTIVATDRSYTVVPPASVGLATAGSGDVLAGIIGGFAAQWYAASGSDERSTQLHGEGEDTQYPLVQCAVEGVVAHGFAAGRLAHRGFLARELAAAVSEVVIPVTDEAFVAVPFAKA